jgi:rfaE bifunctional protein kinase chain/domain
MSQARHASQTKALNQLFSGFKTKTLAVIGDVMLDRYVFGNVSRISPEAPVPVVDVKSADVRLGGAANVALNVHALGCEALLFGVIGSDDNGQTLLAEMKAKGLPTSCIITEAKRPTTCKTRVIAQNHHIVRIDSEVKHAITSETETKILKRLEKEIVRIDAIILEDYNKGVLTKSLIEKIIALAKQHKKMITVDPKHDHFFEFKNVTVFKPNLKEAAEAFGRKFANTDADITAASQLLKKKLNAENILLTRSEKGMTVYNGKAHHIPSAALDVADVSGAGDTVIAVMTAGLANGLAAVEAARLANFAAGIVCSEVGAVAINRDKLYAYALEHF